MLEKKIYTGPKESQEATQVLPEETSIEDLPHEIKIFYDEGLVRPGYTFSNKLMQFAPLLSQGEIPVNYSLLRSQIYTEAREIANQLNRDRADEGEDPYARKVLRLTKRLIDECDRRERENFRKTNLEFEPFWIRKLPEWAYRFIQFLRGEAD